jgi:hypothetical protein
VRGWPWEPATTRPIGVKLRRHLLEAAHSLPGDDAVGALGEPGLQQDVTEAFGCLQGHVGGVELVYPGGEGGGVTVLAGLGQERFGPLAFLGGEGSAGSFGAVDDGLSVGEWVSGSFDGTLTLGTRPPSEQVCVLRRTWTRGPPEQPTSCAAVSLRGAR